MITKLEVSNYKSIKGLSLEMMPFMVLVGPNGAGKTNVVRALELIGHLLSRGNTDPVREQGWAQLIHREKKPARGGLKLSASLHVQRRSAADPTKVLPPIDATVSLALRGKTDDHNVMVVSEELVCRSERSEVKLALREGKVQLEPGDDKDLWSVVLGIAGDWATRERLVSRFLSREGADLEAVEAPYLRLLTRNLGPIFHSILRTCSLTRLRLDASSLRSDARFQPDGEHSLGPTGEGLPVAVVKLRGQGEHPAPAFRPVLEALRSVYPRIEDVRPEAFGSGRVTLNFFEKGITVPIPLDGVSDGVLHALALLVALRVQGTGVLAIEEPENALHPWSIRKIMGGAQHSKRQVLITTHSETVVNAVEDPHSLYVVEASDAGTTVKPAVAIESALATILQESGQQLGNVWMDGTLGGVPGT